MMPQSDVQKIMVALARLEERIKPIQAHIKIADRKFVTKKEFKLIRDIVIGGSGFILISVLGAFVSLILIK